MTIIVSEAVINSVENQFGEFTKKCDEAFNASLQAMEDISNNFDSKIQSIDFNFGLIIPETGGSLPSYTTPTMPSEFTVEWNLPQLSEPPAIAINTDFFSGITPPEYSVIAPAFAFPQAPSSALPATPSPPSALSMPSYPSAPSIISPTLGNITTITLPSLDSPDFSGIESLIASLRNNLPESPELPGAIDFVSLASSIFTSAKPEIVDALTTLQSQLVFLLGGGSGLSDAVALSLRNRAFAAEDQLAFQAEQTAIADWLSRGFTLPGGALEAKLLNVRQQNLDKKSGLNRDLWIEEAKFEIENLRFAVQQGIAYEGMRKEAVIKLYGVCGDLAIKQADVNLKMLEATVSLFRSKIELWQAQFANVRDQIQLELSKIEIYKGELDGQRLINDTNNLTVDVYKAQLGALQTTVDIYKTQVDAANARLQGELGKIQYAAETTKIYVAQVGAWETEWRAYGEGIKAELGKADVFKTMVQGYMSEVEAYSKKIDAAKAQSSTALESIGLSLKTWETRAETYKSNIQAETARITALSNAYEASMRGYAVQHDAQKSYVETEVGKLNYNLSIAKLNVDALIKEAELNQVNVIQLTKIAQDALDGVARTGAQLAGSAMSAMNVGASMNVSRGINTSYSESHNYNYEE